MDVFERARRSAEITMHENGGCPDCQGALRGAHDHYALGKLRQAIGMELGLDFHTSQQLELATLTDRRIARRGGA